jgi:hypothetical protein
MLKQQTTLACSHSCLLMLALACYHSCLQPLLLASSCVLPGLMLFWCTSHSLACQVLQQHHPDVPVHDDLHTLDLTRHATGGGRLDVVVITTPCVDVSARGQGLAQLGQVRPLQCGCDCSPCQECFETSMRVCRNRISSLQPLTR